VYSNDNNVYGCTDELPYSRHLPSILSSASVKDKDDDVTMGMSLRDVMRAFHSTDLYPEGVDPASIEAIKYCRYIRANKAMSLLS
jgi:hypothetical protein